MIRNAIEKILELGDVKQFIIDSRQYTTKKLVAVAEPAPPVLVVNTLKGLVDYLQSGFDRNEIGVNASADNVNASADEPTDATGGLKVALHIVSPRVVEAFLPIGGPWKERNTIIKAEWDRQTFPFDKFLSQEEFVIKLLATVAEDAGTDLEKVLEVAGKIVCEDKTEITDNGVSQAVTVQRGVRQESGKVLPLRPLLMPVRTFTEVDQPASRFVFRMRSEPVALALYEADMGAWEIGAKENIKKYLQQQLPGVPVFM